jgi:Domain of unknown function (DUF5710)
MKNLMPVSGTQQLLWNLWRQLAHHNNGMRINLKTPFAEKDEAKALGARWDPKKKCWYIQNVANLTPFARWITDSPSSSSPEKSRGPATRCAGALKPCECVRLANIQTEMR